MGLDAEPSASKSCRFAVGVPDPDPGPSPSPSSTELLPPPPPLPVPSDDEAGGEGSSGSAGMRRRSPGRGPPASPMGEERFAMREVFFFSFWDSFAIRELREFVASGRERKRKRGGLSAGFSPNFGLQILVSRREEKNDSE